MRSRKTSERPAAVPAEADGPARRLRKWPVLVAVALAAVMITLVAISLPDGVTYEEYEQLKVGMPRERVGVIIGAGEYWHHQEGDKDVTNWVNKDGTYIQAVFDKDGKLVEASWKTGWNPAWEKEEE